MLSTCAENSIFRGEGRQGVNVLFIHRFCEHRNMTGFVVGTVIVQVLAGLPYIVLRFLELFELLEIFMLGF